MMSNVMDDIRMERAAFARDVEYVKEIANDDVIDDRLQVAESQYFKETVEEMEDAAQWVRRLDVSDMDKRDAAEVSRILEATEDLSFDEMIGIED